MFSYFVQQFPRLFDIVQYLFTINQSFSIFFKLFNIIYCMDQNLNLHEQCWTILNNRCKRRKAIWSTFFKNISATFCDYDQNIDIDYLRIYQLFSKFFNINQGNTQTETHRHTQKHAHTLRNSGETKRDGESISSRVQCAECACV